ncbi:hypothetical protein LR48_Vigan07g020600 [Vigna angularis]|uniref:TIR domain-containing protein n=1 Tax=Phaseolus angularis TaxID=3914 RepID=A0A0L9UVA6_PHAAN|nr:hypothetical protein LR48_Vigan07g020600 [Vigna angularis]
MESEQCHDVYLNLKGKIHYGFGGNLCNALRKKGHDKKFGKDSDEVRKWRSAMSRVANLPGLVAGSGYEYEHLEKVVEMVTRSLSRYDIFISFRGPDTRHSFTGFLYQALSRERFKTFMDAEELKDGDKIPSAITEAIESSRLSIVVLSENYADSSSCLDELDTIMKCMKSKNQLVWPIFYKVEPTTVRNQKNTYHQAMAAHEQRYGRDSSKVSKWRQNLSEVADLKGFLLQRDEYEYKLVEEIVKKAIENDNGRYSHVTSLDLSGMNNGDENELASSSPSTSRNQHTDNNDDEDCSSELSVG